MGFHDVISGPTDNHGPYVQVFPNDAARTGDATSYTAAQSVQGGSANPVKAYQVDTNTEYVLDNHSPTTWVAVGGGGGGEANTGANVGTGDAGVFRDKTGTTLNFRRLVGAGAATITENADSITISTSAAAGEANTAANVGTGAGVFRDKTGVSLNFRRLNATGVVSAVENGDSVDVTSTAEANTGANVGTGTGQADVFRDKTGTTLNFRRLIQGASIALTQTADTIAVALGTLTANLAAGNFDGLSWRTLSYDSELDNGNSGAAATVQFTGAQKQAITLTANATLTFDAPPGVGHYQLRVVQDATGGRVVTWVAGAGVTAIKWRGGTPPTLSTAGSAEDIITFFWNETDLYAVGSLNFS